MIGLGSGEILGAIIFGRIGDALSMRILIVANILSAVSAFIFAIWYSIGFEFNFWLAILMTFFWGLQDGGLNTTVNSILGF